MMIMMMMMMMMTMMMKIEFFVGNRRTRNGDSSDPNLRLHPSLAASIHLHLICILFAYHVRVLCAVGQAISSSLYSSIDFFFYWDRGSLFVFFLFCFFFHLFLVVERKCLLQNVSLTRFAAQQQTVPPLSNLLETPKTTNFDKKKHRSSFTKCDGKIWNF